MVIVEVQGGLGNQLFQYAAGRSIAERTGKTVWMDRTFYGGGQYRNFELDVFNTKSRVLSDGVARTLNDNRPVSRLKSALKRVAGTGLVRLHDPHKGYDPRLERLPGHCRVSGYWQSELYFKGIRAQLMSELTLKPHLQARQKEFADRIRSTNAVAVHVRRGDLVASEHYRKTVGTLTADYYRNAIDQIERDVPDAELFVFTEHQDVEWARQHIRSVRPVTFVSTLINNNAPEDLSLMSQCRHYVIANSTLSWWGAWLSSNPAKVVIAPSRFFRVDRAHEVDLLPPTWRKIDTELSDAN